MRTPGSRSEETKRFPSGSGAAAEAASVLSPREPFALRREDAIEHAVAHGDPPRPRSTRSRPESLEALARLSLVDRGSGAIVAVADVARAALDGERHGDVDEHGLAPGPLLALEQPLQHPRVARARIGTGELLDRDDPLRQVCRIVAPGPRPSFADLDARRRQAGHELVEPLAE